MQVVCLPFNERDLFTANDPITVLDPGTGRDERCQVEADWLTPYADGVQRGVRVTFPAVVDPGTRTTFEFRRGDTGAAPAFAARPNVIAGLVATGLTFFAGPRATHFVRFKAAGEPLPTPVYLGARSVVYRWFARIYQPAHAPTLRTQMWCELDIEVFHDEDYAEFSTRWGCCDPRVDEPDGFNRSGFSDADTQVGFEFAIQSPTVCQPVPFFPEQCVVSLTHDGARWRWVQDQRNRYQGQILNDILPWGICAQARGVLLFRGTNGTIGEPLRDASLQAFLSLPEPVFAIANTWGIRDEAYGPVGTLPRPFKRHEHYDRTRDYDYVRGKLELEARTLAEGSSPSDFPYIWYKDNAVGMSIHQQYGSTSTGTHGSWQKLPHYPACAYAVPGLGLYVEKFMQAFAAPFAFREADGRLVTVFEHPELDVDRMSPGRTGGRGDMLGKTADQAWRLSQTSWLIRSPANIGGAIGPANEGTAESHFDQPFPFVQAAVFGSRNMRRFAESLTYFSILGGWQPTEWSLGRTGQPRGLQRGGIMHSWALWMFGADTRLADRCYDSLYTHYYARAVSDTNAQFGLQANRLVKTPNIISPNASAGPDRVELRNYPYFRPWEDGLGVGAWYGIARLGTHQRPELAIWKTVAKDFATDAYRYGTPTEVDASGRILYRYLRPHANGAGGSIYEPGAAVAIGANQGNRALLRTEMQQNNWELCSGQSGNCTASNDGFMRLGTPGAGTTSFTMGAAAYILELEGGVGDVMLTRYVQQLFTTRAGIPGGWTPQFTWLTGEAKWPIAFETVIFGAQRTRGAMPVRRGKGSSMSRLEGQLDHAWVVTDDDTALRRINIATGQVLATVTPSVAPAGGRWSDIHCMRYGEEDMLCVLDGRDTGFNRGSYRFAYTREQTPTTGWQTVAFTFGDGLSRTCSGIAWDPNLGGWLIIARRPAAGSEGDVSIWRVPIAGGVAERDSDRTVLDVDFAEGVDVLEDGRLMAVTRVDGTVDVYAYAKGGYWGSPRNQYTLPSGTSVACFTRHRRFDDSLRLIMVGDGGSFYEVEI